MVGSPFSSKRPRWVLGAIVGILSSFGAFEPILTPAFAEASRSAQTSGAVSAREATRVITLGTVAGPRVRLKRASSANLLQVGEKIYLIDAGPGVSHKLAKVGFEPADITKIFLTHLHFDHVQGLAPLLGYAWVRRRETVVDIYGPPATSLFVDSALQYLSIPEAIYAAQLPPTPTIAEMVKAHDITISRPTVVFQDDKVKVTAVDNTHYITIPADRRPVGANRSYSYRFDTPDRSIVFTGDTGPSDAVAELARGADVLVAEVMDMEGILNGLTKDFNAPRESLKPVAEHMLLEHLSPREVGLIAARAGVKMVLLTHVGPGEDSETDMRLYTHGVREVFSGPVVIASDGSEY